MSLNWDYWTFLRIFLVVGGAIFLVWGLQEGSIVDIGIGLIALVLGGVRLILEYRERTRSKDAPAEGEPTEGILITDKPAEEET